MSDDRKVQGICPSCGWATLFLGSGGYVTCSISYCRNPTLASDLLAEGPTLHKRARTGQRVHHIESLRADLFGIIGRDPFDPQFGQFIDGLVAGDPYPQPSTSTEANP